MKKLTVTGKFGLGKGLIAALAGFVVVGGAVWALNQQKSEDPQALACSSSMNTAKNLKGLTTGEVAAFLPAEKPLNLSELKFNDADGNLITMADLKGTKLLNLWATWCAPCRKEMPHLDKLQREAGNEEFNVIAVNMDRGENNPKPLKFLNDIGVKDLAYFSDHTMKTFNDLRTKGKAPGLPSTIMIGEDGCEIGTMFGPADWAAPEAFTLVNAALAGQKEHKTAQAN
ncbi:Thiol-disulfide isomerase or thioredoxin [Pseudovibrio denitrificans]|uniref:Thiol-disulfide isomerase or thioredoxin n=1 Tax=Pseudovibrio denitrificans TaxID=258256 RepID=A0A1I7AP68_9HYPH|nr:MULTISPECIES: TlpA disulfide reductase family protein [Pseudovibrio]EEA93704.1 redoxin [Pseudovibrio sp. JE062]SFT76771.1 Thiol-disulfide isomerase or thioredoxin [Pseudovibrio denitrificans]